MVNKEHRGLGTQYDVSACKIETMNKTTKFQYQDDSAFRSPLRAARNVLTSFVYLLKL